MATEKSEFENVSSGWIGVMVRGDNGRMRGASVKAGDTIWLDQDEQIATANAPRRDEDNPFENGSLALRTKAKEIVNRRPIGDTELPQVERPTAADADSNGGGEGSPPGEPEEAAATEPPKTVTLKDPLEMSEEEKRVHNAKAAAQRAVARPAPQAPEETGAAPQPGGAPPQGRRAATEQVGTPEAAKGS